MSRETTNGDYNAYAIYLLWCDHQDKVPMSLEEFKKSFDDK